MNFETISAARALALQGDPSALAPLLAEGFTWTLLNKSSTAGQQVNKTDTLGFLVSSRAVTEEVSVLLETPDAIVTSELVTNPDHPDGRYIMLSFYKIRDGQVAEKKSVRGPVV